MHWKVLKHDIRHLLASDYSTSHACFRHHLARQMDQHDEHWDLPPINEFHPPKSSPYYWGKEAKLRIQHQQQQFGSKAVDEHHHQVLIRRVSYLEASSPNDLRAEACLPGWQPALDNSTAGESDFSVELQWVKRRDRLQNWDSQDNNQPHLLQVLQGIHRHHRAHHDQCCGGLPDQRDCGALQSNHCSLHPNGQVSEDWLFSIYPTDIGAVQKK